MEIAAENNEEPLDIILAKLEDIRERHSYWKQREPALRKRSSLLLVCSLDGFIQNGNPKDNDVEPQHIYVDNAELAPLIKVLPLTACGCPITLLGDSHQLPPYCRMTQAELARAEYQTMFLWACSAFHLGSIWKSTLPELREQCLQAQDIDFSLLPQAQLTTTWSFSSELAELLDEAIYHNGFHSHPEANELSIVTIDTVNTDITRESRPEAQAALEYANRNRTENMAIIAPYEEQVELLKSLASLSAPPIYIAAEAPGHSWDTVVVNICDQGSNWAMDSRNKQSHGQQLLLTLLALPKKKLVLIGNIAYWSLQKGQLLGQLVNLAQER